MAQMSTGECRCLRFSTQRSRYLNSAAGRANPSVRRLLVTNHDSLVYFADPYEFTVIGTIVP